MTNQSIQIQWKPCLLFIAGALLVALSSCSEPALKSSEPAVREVEAQAADSYAKIPYQYADNQLTEKCSKLIADAETTFQAIEAIKPSKRTFENTLLAFEWASNQFEKDTTALTFMGYVSTNEATNKQGSLCEQEVEKYGVDLMTRKSLYKALKSVFPRNAIEKRLQTVILEGFEQNGLHLSDKVLKTLIAKLKDIKKLESEYSNNLNNDTSSVDFTAEELEGVPADFIKSLTKNGDKLTVGTDYASYRAIMTYAVKPDTRKALYVAFNNRGVKAGNSKLITDAVKLRAEAASILGFKSWSHYKINYLLAKDADKVKNFLDGLKADLAKKSAEDLEALLAAKKELTGSNEGLKAWDISYLSNYVKERDYSIDSEKIREYFPKDVVIEGMFKVYAKLFGVYFSEVKGADVWHEDVKLYRVHDAKTNEVKAYFYTDFFPRKGKYGHAAAFPLVSGYLKEDGSYNPPVASIVANFSKPTADKPSLLTHGEVETVFHEFGHIMHYTLTQAAYPSLAGFSVPWDFVEAPSQMLENWVWNKEVLGSLSGHYLDHSKKLPEDLLNGMIAAKDFLKGYAYNRQVLFNTFDQTIHTSSDGNVDPFQVFNDAYNELFPTVEDIPNNHREASFGHMMGGYDAKYYSYLWSEVMEADMFTQFEKNGLLDEQTGLSFKKNILESGNVIPIDQAIETFLGRELNDKAFRKKLGLN